MIKVAGIAGYKFKSGRNVGYSFDNARKATYSYDADNGRLVGLEAEGEREFTFGYFPNSHLQNTIVYPNGMIKTVNYEQKRDLITSIAHGADTAPISAFAYTNDALGRRTSMTRTFDDVTKTIDYGYNDRSEVTSANEQGNNQYAYAYDFDNIGNRKSAIENGTAKAYQTNALNQYVDTSIVFDADGNQTTIKTATGIWNVEYNGENRPVKFTQGDTIITMDYDYMGRRFAKTVNGNMQLFVYDNYLQIAELNEDSQIVKSYIWDPSAGYASRPLATTIGNDFYYYTHDANKNISELVYESGAVSDHYEYSPFGAITAATGPLANTNPFLFSSEYLDKELGLMYYNYRHYNPTTGRWLSRDPIEEEGGWNLYGMVTNNITNFIDFLGLSCCKFKSFGQSSRDIIFTLGTVTSDPHKGYNATTVEINLNIYGLNSDAITILIFITIFNDWSRSPAMKVPYDRTILAIAIYEKTWYVDDCGEITSDEADMVIFNQGAEIQGIEVVVNPLGDYDSFGLIFEYKRDEGGQGDFNKPSVPWHIAPIKVECKNDK